MPRSAPSPHNQPIGLSTDTLNDVDDDQLDLTFAALADPTRRAILARLAQGRATVNVLAEPFEMTLQSVSRHLKVLEGAGLITRGRDAQFRPCTFSEEPLERAVRWIEQSRETWRRGTDTDRTGGGDRTGGAERIGEAGGRRRPCGKTRLSGGRVCDPWRLGKVVPMRSKERGRAPRAASSRRGTVAGVVTLGVLALGAGPPAGRSGSGRGGGSGGRQRHGPPCHLVRLTDLADRRDPGRLAADRPLLAQRGEPAGWTGRGGR